jgi:hypothetical protein
MVQAVIQTTVTGLQGNPVATGTPSGNQSLTWNGTAWAAAGPFLTVSGGTLTGPLQLAGNATAALQPVALQQLQAGYLPLTGGTLSGNLTVGGASLNLGTVANIQAPAGQFTVQNISGGALNLITLFATQLETANSLIAINSQGIVYSSYGPNAIGFSWGPPNVGVYINGTYAGAISVTASDPRLKTNIAPISVDPLSIINQITLQKFDLTLPLPDSQPEAVSVGLMTDQLSQLLPEAVVEGPTFNGVSLLPLVSYLIGATQRLVTMIQQLQGAVGTLQQNANAAVTAWTGV